MATPIERLEKNVSECISEIDRLLKEIDEISVGFNSIYENEIKEKFDDKLYLGAEEILKRIDSLSPHHKSLYKKYLKEAEKDKKKLLAHLKEKKKELEEKIAVIEAKKKSIFARLKKENPKMNTMEEEQKKVIEKTRKEIEKEKEELKKLEKGIGKISNLMAIRKKRLKINKLINELKAQMEKLKGIRETWFRLKDRLEDKDETLEKEWENAMAELSQVRQSLLYLEDFDKRVQVEALKRLLADESVKSPPIEGIPILEELFAEKGKSIKYQKGLSGVAQIMGILKGIKKGLENLLHTINDLKKQQQEYSPYLPTLKIRTPKSLKEMEKAVKELKKKVINEKYMIEHPLQFYTTVEDTISQHFTSEKIEYMFKELGSEIKNSTKAWQ